MNTQLVWDSIQFGIFNQCVESVFKYCILKDAENGSVNHAGPIQLTRGNYNPSSHCGLSNHSGQKTQQQTKSEYVRSNGT